MAEAEAAAALAPAAAGCAGTVVEASTGGSAAAVPASDAADAAGCKLAVAERFVSLNGEGPRAGKRAAFIRFRGCNLACSYCDTRWACDPACPVAWESVDDLASFVAAEEAELITLTGGEPMLQPALAPLVKRLAALPQVRFVEIETNGAVDVGPIARLRADLLRRAAPGRPMGARVGLTMDWKLPSSGMERHMLRDNVALLASDDTVKFVIGDESDLRRAAEVVRAFDLTSRCNVFFSPVFGAIDPADIARFVVGRRLNGVTLQVQLHKILWPGQEKGV
ncbi:radical SAM protein [Xiamenia xianingshaonis]|uniref:radical SAM protein n=1 Tax=Xiamenia xianingshaonis TaxID=2682776 RepID=UPI0028F6D62B|nr:radical SAM protein [Xiamenia xianingshaonis]